MYFNGRGSITVFICIMLAILIPLSCVLIDTVRYSMAKKQVEAALKTCADSMLAAYDRQLREQYGLFAMYPRDIAAMEEELYELLCRNLNVGASVDGVSDIYGFNVRKVDVIPFYNYSEPFVMRQQVAEFMKYRAPVQVVQEFYEKIKLMMGLMKEAEMVEKKMGLDKLMNDIRKSLVNIYFLLKDKLPLFNCSSQGGNETIKDSSLKSVVSSSENASKEVGDANNHITAITQAQTAYIELYDDYIRAKEHYEFAERTLQEAEAELENAETRLKELNAALNDGASQYQAAYIKKMIEDLEAVIPDLIENCAYADNAFMMAYESYMHMDNEIAPYRKELDEKLNITISSLDSAVINNNQCISSLQYLYFHISQHISFHTDTIALIDEVLPQMDEMEKQSQSLTGAAKENDSAVSDRIQGELKKQLQCIKKETFTDIRARLSSNLHKLEAWKQAVEKCLDAFETGAAELESARGSALAVKEEPHNENNRYQGYGGYGQVTAAVTVLESDISDLKSLGEMKGYFIIPEFLLEPQPNSIEEKEFNKWFNNRYGGDISENPADEDDSELKKVRQGIGDFAKDVGGEAREEREQSENVTGSDSGSAEDFQYLPSQIGPTSSDSAIERIGREIQESLDNQAVSECLYDRPVEGLDNVNEEDKNFFDYEMARILELIGVIRDLIANGLEAAIENLYMNEYIISAFKSAGACDGPEHDIGWGRPLEQTYFEKAEVEYILFGQFFEKANIACSKLSIFALRLIFNLLHVYTDPDKIAAALTLATAIAGWTIFGVPLVQNFLLIGWAAFESYIDVDILLKGGFVPLVKTSSSWYLGIENAADSLKNIFLRDIKEFAQNQIEKHVNDASEAIEETVSGIIDAKIDEVFAPFETKIDEVTGIPDLEAEAASLFDISLIAQMDFTSMDSFTESLDSMVKSIASNIAEKIKSFTQEKVARLKSALKERIRKLIFQDSGYAMLVEKVKKVGNDLLDKGISAVTDKIDSAMGKLGSSRSNNISGRLIMMDYTDYMRVLLLAVPAEKKCLRTADLMELNLRKVSGNNNLSIDDYKTYIFIKAEVDFNPWFLPDYIFKKDNAGMICVEWSQGY